jgi:hypothetical protein
LGPWCDIRMWRTSQTVERDNANSRLAFRTDFMGLRRKDCRTLSTVSSECDGRPVLLPLHRQPVSMSCVCQRLMEFLSGGSTSNCRRKLRWTVITDVVFAYSTAQNAFCCLVGAILKILCPR